MGAVVAIASTKLKNNSKCGAFSFPSANKCPTLLLLKGSFVAVISFQKVMYQHTVLML